MAAFVRFANCCPGAIAALWRSPSASFDRRSIGTKRDQRSSTCRTSTCRKGDDYVALINSTTDGAAR
jgi:hypothetical protein